MFSNRGSSSTILMSTEKFRWSFPDTRNLNWPSLPMQGFPMRRACRWNLEPVGAGTVMSSKSLACRTSHVFGGNFSMF